MALEMSERMKEFLLNNKKDSRVAFGTTLDRELLPLKTPHTRAGNEMGLRGVPNLGPGSYNNDLVSSFVHSLNQRPICKKGYSLGARTASRFRDEDNEIPGPPAYQEIISKPREFSPAEKPFECGATRFPKIKQDFTPGPGAYQHEVRKNRKMQFHSTFGGPQTLKPSIRTICLKDGKDPCLMCSKELIGDFYMNSKDEMLCRICHQDITMTSSNDKQQKKFLSKFDKVRDCSDIHSHEGTKAKLRLKSEKDIKKLKTREAYLSLYYD